VAILSITRPASTLDLILYLVQKNTSTNTTAPAEAGAVVNTLHVFLSEQLIEGGETNKYIDELGQTMIHTKSEEAEKVLTEQAKEKPVQASDQQQ